MIRVDGKVLWNVLKFHGVGAQLLTGVKVFHKEASACMQADGKLKENFCIGAGLRSRYAMSPKQLDIFIDGCISKMKTQVGKKN